MKHIFIYSMVFIPLLFLFGNIRAQSVNIPDYGAVVIFKPASLEKISSTTVIQTLQKEFEQMYVGYVKESSTFVLLITSNMAGSAELRERLKKLYPEQTVKQISSKEYELYEKKFE